EAVLRPGELPGGPREGTLGEVHRLPGLRARVDLEADPRPLGCVDVLLDVANVVRVIMRVDGGNDRLVGDRGNRLSDVVVHAFERVEHQHAAFADVEDGAVIEGL